MNTDILKKLQLPFKDNEISKLPKPYSRTSEKGNCKECGGYHGLPAMHLDYVGHAALTKRLLDVDPLWTWEAMAIDEFGAPKLDAQGGMWIKLTVAGMTRIGYGHPDGKTGGNAVKETIGDALRNAAMRFGVALDLWHKGDLYDSDEIKGMYESSKTEPPAEPLKKVMKADIEALEALDGEELTLAVAKLRERAEKNEQTAKVEPRILAIIESKKRGAE